MRCKYRKNEYANIERGSLHSINRRGERSTVALSDFRSSAVCACFFIMQRQRAAKRSAETQGDSCSAKRVTQGRSCLETPEGMPSTSVVRRGTANGSDVASFYLSEACKYTLDQVIEDLPTCMSSKSLQARDEFISLAQKVLVLWENQSEACKSLHSSAGDCCREIRALYGKNQIKKVRIVFSELQDLLRDCTDQFRRLENLVEGEDKRRLLHECRASVESPNTLARRVKMACGASAGLTGMTGATLLGWFGVVAISATFSPALLLGAAVIANGTAAWLKDARSNAWEAKEFIEVVHAYNENMGMSFYSAMRIDSRIERAEMKLDKLKEIVGNKQKRRQFFRRLSDFENIIEGIPSILSDHPVQTIAPSTGKKK